MPIRNAHRVGDYLMVDDESGHTHYASEMVQIWDGTWRHCSNTETRHPQEFVKARNDPRALMNVRPAGKVAEPDTTFSLDIGATSVLTNINGAAFHLFRPGIGKMVIEDTNELIVFEVS